MVQKYRGVKKLWSDMGYIEKDLQGLLYEEFRIDLEIVKKSTRRFWIREDTANIT